MLQPRPTLPDAMTTAPTASIASRPCFRLAAVVAVVALMAAIGAPGTGSAQSDSGPRAEPGQRQRPAATAPKPDDPLAAARPETPAERAKLLNNLYAYLATAGSAEEALPISAAIERLWALHPSDTINYLMGRAAQALAEKNTAVGLRFMDEVVELAPDYAEGWNRRAYLHFLNSDLERALGDLRRCIALEPAHYRALEALGVIFRDRGQNEAALKLFDKLLEIHPNMPGAQEARDALVQAVKGQRT